MYILKYFSLRNKRLLILQYGLGYIIIAKLKKQKQTVDLIFDLLLSANNGYQDTDNIHYFPISTLMDGGFYDLAYQLLLLCEDENCTFNTDCWVYLQEGMCLYMIKKYD